MTNYKFNSGRKASPNPVNASLLGKTKDNFVHVNFRHYQRRQECLSDWQSRQLKQLSGWFEKMSNKTPDDVTSDTSNCHAHVGVTKPLPRTVSRDVRMYGLKVGKKERIHGFFLNSDFFVVWLDRNHQICK